MAEKCKSLGMDEDVYQFGRCGQRGMHLLWPFSFSLLPRNKHQVGGVFDFTSSPGGRAVHVTGAEPPERGSRACCPSLLLNTTTPHTPPEGFTMKQGQPSQASSTRAFHANSGDLVDFQSLLWHWNHFADLWRNVLPCMLRRSKLPRSSAALTVFTMYKLLINIHF